MASLTTVETSYGSGSRPLGPLTWAALRAMDTSGVHVGDFVEVSDLGYSHWVWNGTIWRPRVPLLLHASAAAANVTGTTVETVLATVTIPAGAMGPTGGVMVNSTWSYTNSANNKVVRWRFGGAAGATYLAATHTTSASFSDPTRRVRNRSAASQVGSAAAGGFSASSSTSAVSTSAVDSSAPVDIVFTGQLTLGSESITLENREVWLLS